MSEERRKRILYVNEDEDRNNLDVNPCYLNDVEILAYSDVRRAIEAGIDFNLFVMHNGVSTRDAPFEFARYIRDKKPDALIVAISQTGLSKKDYLRCMNGFQKKVIFDDLLERAPRWKEDFENVVNYLLTMEQNVRDNSNQNE